MTTFFENYKHPNWQRKRLEIMRRDNFECTNCSSKDKTLNVHHSYYERDKLPWEYPDQSLRTLCEKCHEDIQASTDAIKRSFANLDSDDMQRLLGYAKGIAAVSKRTEQSEICSLSEAEGFGAAWVHDHSCVGHLCGDQVLTLFDQTDGEGRGLVASDAVRRFLSREEDRQLNEWRDGCAASTG